MASTAALVVAAAGCASKPPPSRDNVVDSSIGKGTVRSAWKEAAEAGTVPDGWLKSFNDPKMEALVVESIKNNLALRGAATRVDAAAAASVQAAARMKPLVTAGGGGGVSATDGNTTGEGGAGLNVSWELDVWGRLRAGRSAAEEQLITVQQEYEFVRESLAAQTAKAWYLACDARQQLELAKENVKVYSQLLDVVRAKAKAGQLGSQDVSLAQADLTSAQERERFADGAYKEAIRSLEVLLGRYPSAELEAANQFIPVPAAAPAGVPAEVLERRPDMIAAEANVRAAFQNVQAAKLAKLPRITLSASGGATSNAGFFQTGANFFAPIYDGGRLEAQVKIETADQELALANYGQNALTAFKEVENALAADRLLLQREQLLKSTVEHNAEALRLAKIQFDNGKVSMIDVLQMQARTNLSKSAVINMGQVRLARRIDLYLALGGSFEEAPPAATKPAS